ncbi:hypothetical protein [Sedimenticola hydrogenitrophicus]|uniref:hypothetical protein n=1 Tax=Sedimenticola hydrogenitrophicus TaxID=2967975 RepID=UPI0021A3E355|nr:hypothetical protein [Sedimenticola hydrogenitrophicus]
MSKDTKHSKIDKSRRAFLEKAGKTAVAAPAAALLLAAGTRTTKAQVVPYTTPPGAVL